MTIDNPLTTRLLTVLNVTATKRKWDNVDFIPAEKLNKRRAVRILDIEQPAAIPKVVVEEKVEIDLDGQLEEEQNDSVDPYESHFGCSTSILSEISRSSVDRKLLKVNKLKRKTLGVVVESIPEGAESVLSSSHAILERLYTHFKAKQSKKPKDQIDLQTDILSALSNYQDLYHTSSTGPTKKSTREAISLHVLNHITKKRRRILKNNERIAHTAKSDVDSPEDVQDQGFTRPSILVLLPFRSSALDWFHAIISHTPPSSFQIENQARFVSEYSLPSDAIDKLVTAEPGTYPQDHVDTFKGNIDDSFRVGIKLNRKSVKMFSEFYGSDIIIASPLGLRQSIQKEKSADYLSSIEIVVMDQLDAMAMQNWDHVKFIIDNLNNTPKESHDTDFSRIKPWYLDGQAKYLRQSILLTALETPLTRSVYNNDLKNVAGKMRLERQQLPMNVPAGIDQSFVRFDCSNPSDEADQRFNYFTTQLLPQVLKSAVQSTNTVVFVPSSFDFIRVHNYFRKTAAVSFTVLSEYSSNQDISRARQSFFKGSKAVLLVSERFHFYKRYKLRGIRNLIFYGPPEHPQYYTEYLSFPFLDQGVEASDVTSRVLYSKYDWFSLDRITGTEAAQALIKAD